MRILYVEDNPANLFLVQRVARMGNHQVINYSEGQLALDNFAKDKPDLVLMDVQLPGKLTGLDVVKALRDAGHKTPIIAVTAYAMIGDRERCLQVGCNAYIAKPLPVAELVEVLKHYESQLPAASAPAPAAAPAQPAKPEVPAEQPVTAPAQASTPSPQPTPASQPEASAPAKPAEPAPTPEAKPVAAPSVTPAASTSGPLPTTPEVKPVVEPTPVPAAKTPEKPVEMTTVVTGGQNAPSKLSSN